MTTMETAPNDRSARTAGIVLIGASLLSILLMAHHPTADAHDSASLAADIAGKANLSRFVHGGLIALIAAQIFAFTIFAARIGAARTAARAGLVAYVIGAGAMIGAALISGFVVSDLADHYAGAPDAAAFEQLARLAMTGNQALAKLGVIAMSAAIVLWAIAFMHERGGHWLAIVGILAGVLPATALALGFIRLNVSGMMLVVVAETVWNLAAGVYLIRSKARVSVSP
jgi:hypothetical protein